MEVGPCGQSRKELTLEEAWRRVDAQRQQVMTSRQGSGTHLCSVHTPMLSDVALLYIRAFAVILYLQGVEETDHTPVPGLATYLQL
jgi:hypothetical protein